MSLRTLQYLRVLAILVFCGTGLWVAFWHHKDGPIYFLAILPSWAILVCVEILKWFRSR